MIAAETKASAAGASARQALPLENGEALQSFEFLKRYERMPQVKKAELIEGIVYLGSPVSVRHSKPDALIQVWLGTYASHHPEVEVHTNATVILDVENTVQPDALLRLEGDDYRPLVPDADGVLNSLVFPVLRLPVAPLLAGETAKVIEALQAP